MKVRYIRFGFAPKESQLRKFKKFEHPTLYVCAFHNLAGTRKLIANIKTVKSARRKIRERMTLDSIYLISPDIVEKMYCAERMPMTSSIDGFYCIIKISLINRFFDDKPFKRGDQQCTIKSHLKIDRDTLHLKNPSLKEGWPAPCGYIISKKYMPQYEDFLNQLDIK